MLIAFNKPYNVISQFGAHPRYGCLKDYIAVPGVYPAGRLDADSEGLLLLTDDGALQAKIAHPRYAKSKTYFAQVENIPDENALEKLRQGVDLGDFVTQPAEVFRLPEYREPWARTPPIRVRKNIPDSWIALTVREGKNRQVRRMCAKTGYPCLRLIRMRIGRLDLAELALAPGQWRQIDAAEIG